MRHDKLERELRLLLLLAENHNYTVDELCGKLSISRRNLYYYLEFFRDSGFKVEKRGAYYAIDRSSPFFDHLVSRISFTEEEAVLLRRMLDKAEHGNALIANLKKKLEQFYDFDILADEQLREHAVQNIGPLYDAIKLKRQVVLKGYASPHSRTVRDRFVEPFLLMNNNNEVRCYEMASGMNKTFKISRMEGVVVLDSEWAYADRHRQMFTDPQAKPFITDAGGGGRLLRLDVCSYAGIGRFVLGLYDDIQVLGGDGFRRYLDEKISRMQRPR